MDEEGNITRRSDTKRGTQTEKTMFNSTLVLFNLNTVEWTQRRKGQTDRQHISDLLIERTAMESLEKTVKLCCQSPTYLASHA